jgi:carboxypeptidase C (cathepsin A)
MFYQMFSAPGVKPRTANPKVPVLVWLQGGPGASSQFGCFTEIGPIRIVNGTAKANSWAWNLFGHLVFIDSPLNVGFSYAGTNRTGEKQVNSTEQATNHLLNFLVNFYDTWPELAQSPLILTGESFAGHYIPVLAKKILTNTTLKFKLGAVAIGDGWTDPMNQINYYDTYLWSVGVIDRGFRDTCTWFQTNGIINMYERDFVKVIEVVI